MFDSIRYIPYRLWYRIKDVYYSIKYFMQLIFRGYPDPDVWGLDEAIARFTVPRLKALMKCINGCPEGLTLKKWKDILKKILWSLEWVRDGYGDEDPKMRRFVKRTKAEIERDAKKYGSESKWFYNPDYQVIFHKKRYEAMHKKYEDGIYLFGKYFYRLWD